MILSHEQNAALEKVLKMYEDGTSLRRIAREIGILTQSGESTVSTFFSVLRSIGIDPVRRKDGYMVRMSDHEKSQYEKWLFTQRNL